MRLADVPEDLVKRCRQGDQDAFDELFRLLHEDLHRWLYSLLRNDEDAQEALQECFVRIYRHLHLLQDDRKFAGWVGRLVVNQANTYRTRAGRTRMESLEDGLEVEEERLPIQGRSAENPREVAERGEVFELVNAAVQELPPRQRTAVLLFDVKGFSIREIAEQLGCSQGVVKFNIFQGRRKLRARLGALAEHYMKGSGRDEAQPSG